MLDKRGRPANTEPVALTKFELEFVDHYAGTTVFKFDFDKNPNGAYLVENKIMKGEKNDPVINKNQYYGQPVVMVFKTSNRSNAKTKMKVWNNTNIDWVLNAKELPGVPEIAEILEIAVGEKYIEKYKKLYKIS